MDVIVLCVLGLKYVLWKKKTVLFTSPIILLEPEVSELIGISMLYLIGKKYNSKNIGLYRDYGLAVFKNVIGPASEKMKKQLRSLFN